MRKRIFTSSIFIVIFNILGLLDFKATSAEINTSKIKIEKIGTVYLPWGLAVLTPYEVLVTTKRPSKIILSVVRWTRPISHHFIIIALL